MLWCNVMWLLLLVHSWQSCGKGTLSAAVINLANILLYTTLQCHAFVYNCHKLRPVHYSVSLLSAFPCSIMCQSFCHSCSAVAATILSTFPRCLSLYGDVLSSYSGSINIPLWPAQEILPHSQLLCYNSYYMILININRLMNAFWTAYYPLVVN